MSNRKFFIENKLDCYFKVVLCVILTTFGVSQFLKIPPTIMDTKLEKTIQKIQPKFDYSQLKTNPFCDNETRSDSGKKYLGIRMNAISRGYGLGNRLFEIFALRGMAKQLNRTPIITLNDIRLVSRIRNINKTNSFLLENIESKFIKPSKSSRYPLFGLSRVYQFHKFFECDKTEYMVIDGSLFQSFKYFTRIETDIRKMFEPEKKNMEKVKKMVKEQDKSQFKTCVHIRRGDFRKTGRLEATNGPFTVKAMKFLGKKHGGVVYIFSNDPSWVTKNVIKHLNSNIGVYNLDSSKLDPIYDLYFSKFWCDSVLITAPSSTFGWWLGYLAKRRENVYYRDIFDTTDKFKFQMIEEDYFLPSWIKIGYDKKKEIIIK